MEDPILFSLCSLSYLLLFIYSMRENNGERTGQDWFLYNYSLQFSNPKGTQRENMEKNNYEDTK